MGNPFQFTELARRQEGESIFDVRRPAGIMAQLLRAVIAQPQPLARQTQAEIPGITPIAPVAIPLRRLLGMAEKLNLHLLKFARAEGEVARCDLVAEALAHLSDAER